MGRKKKKRRFYIDGEIYTAIEWGRQYLKNSYERTKGTEEETINPDIMTDEEVEKWAMLVLMELMEDGTYDIWEIDD